MMKFQPIELKKGSNRIEMPPVGGYVAEIKNARIVEASSMQRYHKLELFIDIIEGEYANRFTEIWEDQKERGYDKAKFKGIFRLSLPTDGQDNSKVERWLSGQLFCVFDSNTSGGATEYRWDGDPKSLIGKKVGINMRRKLYTFKAKDENLVDAETTEIGRLETVDDVRSGRIRKMSDNDRRDHGDNETSDGGSFEDVSKTVEVPWG